jgi:hypothetical protein
MKKTYFYTIEIGLIEDTLDGNKAVSIYDIVDNTPKLIETLELSYEDNSRAAIRNWLSNNNLEVSAELIQL